MKITFWTDGSSRGNPGKGGWGVFIEMENNKGEKKEFSLSGGKLSTTNNRMELTAAIQALRFLDSVFLNKYFIDQKEIKKDLLIIIKTDSKYVKTGIEEWIINWEKNNWKNANKKPVLNKDLWQELLSLKNSINDRLIKDNISEIKWEYVKGHFGIKGNEIADKFSTEAADNILE